MAAFSADAPQLPLRLLFIHHSCGGQWLADVGENEGRRSIYTTAVNGGGLRRTLEASGYEVHEASYGSRVGDKTDLFDWPAKFREQMDEVLACDRQDSFFTDGRRNQIVVFKSCFHQNRFVARGRITGTPENRELTVEDAKDAYRSLLPEFARHPDVLFVVVTAPPLVRSADPLYKVVGRWLLGRASPGHSAMLAREFNDWLADSDSGWLSASGLRNVVVFDYFDVLTEFGRSDFLCYPSGPDQTDNHPSAAGNQKATAAVVPLLNRAVRRAGLSQ